MSGAGEFGYEQTFFSENLRPIPANTLLKISQVNFDTTFCKKSESRCRYYFCKKSESLPKRKGFFYWVFFSNNYPYLGN